MALKEETVKLSVITGISIFFGLFFNILLGRRLGVSWQMDSFFVVIALFGWLGVFHTFFTALYIPVFNEIKKNDEKDSLVFADVVLKWVTIVSVVIVIIVLAFDDAVIRILAPGFTPQGIALSIEINAILMVSLIFFTISYTVMLTLNALYYYSVPSVTYLFDPLFNIASVYLLVPSMGVKGIAVSYLVSNVMKAGFLLLYLHMKTGWKLTARMYHPQVPALINKSTRMAFSGFVWSLKDVIVRNIASRLGEGAVTLFSYADKLVNILIQITVVPLARVFYTRVSEWAASSKWEDIRWLFMRTIRISMLVALFITGGSIVFLPSMLNIFFYQSKFSTGDIGILSALFKLMVGYFLLLSFEVYLSRIIYSLKKVGIVTLSAVSSAVALFISISMLSRHYGIYGLPLGVIFAEFLVCVIYYVCMKKALDLSMRALMRRFLPMVIVALVFVSGGIFVGNIVNNDLIMVFGVLPVWLLLYFLAARITAREELKILFSK